MQKVIGWIILALIFGFSLYLTSIFVGWKFTLLLYSGVAAVVAVVFFAVYLILSDKS